MSDSISIKGTREGLTVTIGTGNLAALLDDLTQHLQSQGAFFRGGRVALQVGERSLGRDDLARISALLAEHEMVLRTVVTTNPITEQAASALGLRLTGSETAPAPASSGPPSQASAETAQPLDGGRGVLVRHLVRSGQVVRHTGHVVVLGDVNVGGQIIAGGDIIIWGRLYGTAHAGAMGSDAAVVCALELAPLQLRIGNLVARPDENDRAKSTYPEIAHVRDNAIVVERWDRALRRTQ